MCWGIKTKKICYRYDLNSDFDEVDDLYIDCMSALIEFCW